MKQTSDAFFLADKICTSKKSQFLAFFVLPGRVSNVLLSRRFLSLSVAASHGPLGSPYLKVLFLGWEHPPPPLPCALKGG